MADLIDRQAAIDTAIEAADEWDGGTSFSRDEIIERRLKMIPAVHVADIGKKVERTDETAQNVQDEDLISKLSEIRSEYNCFDEDGEPQYRALSEAIRILSQRADGDTISRQAAVELAMKYCPDDDGAVQCDGDIRGLLDELENLPAAQPEQRTDEWIPISKETNPTKSGWYLVTVMAEFYATDGMWYDIDEPTDMYLRWMPLPEPYRGGEE